MNPVEIVSNTIDNGTLLTKFDCYDLAKKILSDLNNNGFVLVKKESKASLKYKTAIINTPVTIEEG